MASTRVTTSEARQFVKVNAATLRAGNLPGTDAFIAAALLALASTLEMTDDALSLASEHGIPAW